LICLVTDRHRLSQRLAVNPDGGEMLERLADLVGMASAAGIDLVQVRENDLDGQTMVGWVRRFIETARGTATRIVVNDRFDVALAARAHGVHLKDGAVALARIRAAAPEGFLIGQSVHSPERAGESDADYLVFGTVFPTRSKAEAHALAGLTGLEAAARRSRVPVLGIGGVKVAQLADLARTGAAGIAAVELFLPGGPGLVAPLPEIAAEVRRSFDTAGPAS
jgi:thiamine-phosphate diphosphorylase